MDWLDTDRMVEEEMNAEAELEKSELIEGMTVTEYREYLAEQQAQEEAYRGNY